MAGDTGAALAARLRDVVERESTEIPDGDDDIVAEKRLAEGDILGIDEAVLLRGIPVGIR